MSMYVPIKVTLFNFSNKLIIQKYTSLWLTISYVDIKINIIKSLQIFRKKRNSSI